MKHASTALLMLLALPAAPALAADGEWNVEDAHGPQAPFEYDATEGTWISVDVSPDGEHVVFDLLGHLYEMPLAGGSASALTSGRSWNMFPRYSPDGTRLLFTSDRGGSNDLWVLDRADGELENVTDDALPVFQGTWSVDGRHVYGTALNQRVRFPAFRFSFHGTKQELVPADERRPVNYFDEHPENGLVYFARHGGDLFRSGPRLETYNLETGVTERFRKRPGGASCPRLSPDGKTLAYIGRDDRETILVLHELATGAERVLCRTLDHGRMESRDFYGPYPNYAWHPNGQELLISFGGRIQSLDVRTGAARQIPFEAHVERELTRTIRFKNEVPREQTRTRSARWGQRAPNAVLFEALGDLWVGDGESAPIQLTSTPEHETNPVFDPVGRRTLFARWSDAEQGAIFELVAAGGVLRKLTDVPSQYGSIAVSPADGALAWVRGANDLATGTKLESQTAFELVHYDAEGNTTVVTKLAGNSNRYARRPPTVRFSPDGDELYFTEFVDDTLTLVRIRRDGENRRELYTFPHATRAVVSPDFEWIAFREYHRTYVTPLEFAGEAVHISAADGRGYTRRVDPEDGDFTEWSADSKTLCWTRGTTFCEKALSAILADDAEGAVQRTELAIVFDVAAPASRIAFTGVRVLTMDADDTVLENATIVIEGDHIAAIGTDVALPPRTLVYALPGHTVMPGMFDAHGHYGSPISTLNVVEQRLWGLAANLAYGVTTMFDVYGTTQKDFWASDMLRKGDLVGPRIFSVGDPIFVTKYRSKMHRPIHSAADALEHAAFNKAHGAPALKDYSNHTRAARQQLAAACRELELNLVTESFGNPQMNLTQLVDGFTGIEHTFGLTPLYDDVVSLFAATEAQMTPTLIVVYNGPSGETWFHQNERLWEDEKLLRFYRKEELLRLRRPTHYWEDDFYHVEMARDLRKLAQAGVLLNMGAHGQMMGLGAHWEMELFVHGGFTPLEALRIATINGFRHHGLDGQLGSLEAGKLADLVVLKENPLEDIRNTRSILTVMKNGFLYSGDDAARIHPVAEPAPALYFK